MFDSLNFSTNEHRYSCGSFSSISSEMGSEFFFFSTDETDNETDIFLQPSFNKNTSTESLTTDNDDQDDIEISDFDYMFNESAVTPTVGSFVF